MGDKNLAKATEELMNLVKSEQEKSTEAKAEEKAVGILQKAINFMKGNSEEETTTEEDTTTDDLTKSVEDTTEEATTEKETEEADLEKSTETEEETKEDTTTLEKSESDEDVNARPSVEDVETGKISADEFLAKSLEFMDSVMKTVGGNVARLNERFDALEANHVELAKSNEAVSNGVSALLSSSLELHKSISEESKLVANSSVMGRERNLTKAIVKEEVTVPNEDRKELNETDKKTLYKAYYVDNGITHDE